ncbi:MAG: DUF1573 domain-containing protein [Bacteroidales bacterium]|nr:DUF1573 domain-containing protein [Bacteroidales bacterium]
MTRFIIIISIIVFSFNVNAQEVKKNTNPNAAVLRFEQKKYDYGTIYQNSYGEIKIGYTNTGKEPLIFARVKSSCGCTTPKWSRQPLMPGQSDTLKIIYDTKRLGAFNKSITISSNASVPKMILRIKGKVIPEASVIMPENNLDTEFSPTSK